MPQKGMNLTKDFVKKLDMDYLLYLPEDYDGVKKFPVIFFLHGTGERGKNLDLVKKHGVSKIAEAKPNFPFIVVSPQCPVGFPWISLIDELYELLSEIKTEYSVDEKRVFFTGLTIGAEASWLMAIKHPEEITGIVPLTGGWKNQEDLLNLKNVAVWAFHGEKDTIAPVESTKTTVDFLIENNGNAKLTVLPECGHDVWTTTYASDELYEWMLAQSK